MDPMTLEDHIEAALQAAPSVASLTDTYTDEEDRYRVRQRSLIAATLRAVFTYSHQSLPRNADGSVDVEPDQSVFSELASAMRNFEHDSERANRGKDAELVLRPVGREGVDTAKTITAARKNVIRWLALIDLWDGERDRGFTSQTQLFKFASQKGAGKPGSLRTGLSNLRRGEASGPDLVLFYDMIDLAKRVASTGDGASPFELLLPAIVALSETATKRTID